MKGAKGGSWAWSWRRRRGIFGKWGFESREITDSSERMTQDASSGTVSTVPFWFFERRDGLNTEYAEEDHPSRETLRASRRHGEERGKDGPPMWRTGTAVAMEIRRGEEISTGRWGICNFGLRIADMKRRVGLCLVALLPA